MMQEIKYNGMTSSPSEYDCVDGDVALMMNLANENGAIVPVAPPETLRILENNQKVVYIHKTSDYCNYIIYESENEQGEGKIRYYSDDNSEIREVMTLHESVLYKVDAIGNTLVVLTDEKVYYVIFKSGKYEIMDDRPEFPAISFSLYGKMRAGDRIYISFEPFYTGGMIGAILSDNASNTITEKSLAYANSTSAKIKESGEFLFPFMVRYAYRLYDGSLYMHSVPINMMPSQGTSFIFPVAGIFIDDKGNLYQIDTIPFNISSKLYYKITNAESLKKSLESWRDIIKSIDIFITEPYRFYDPEAKCKKLSDTFGVTEYSYGWYGDRDDSDEMLHTKLNLWDIINLENVKWRIPLKIKESEEMASVFRHISTIKLEQINGEDNAVNIEKGALQALSSREEMSGDSMQFDTIVAKHSFVYNSRLNLTGISTVPRKIALESCFQFLNGERDDVSKRVVQKVYSYKGYVFIQGEKTDVLVENVGNIGMNLNGNYFFYPNANAYRLVLEREDEGGVKMYSDTKLMEHELLNGAYTRSFSEFTSNFDSSVLLNKKRSISSPNKIYTSEVNNPFVFPAIGVNSVGSGEIIGIRAATKALSQGQFGQFPLYAFTDEGVWALEVSGTGGYSAKQPATRDVCNNPDSITQIDNAVIFSTGRGMMLIQGSESICLSEDINDIGFDISKLPGYDQIVRLAGFESENLKFISFLDYIKSCGVSFDYKNQRVVVFNKDFSYAYSYSLRSKTWSLVTSLFSYAVNSYPDSYVMTRDHKFVNISVSDNGQLHDIKGLIVSRPIKLGSPDVLKTIGTCVHRGVFQLGGVKTVVYGSRDLINWFVVSSSENHYLRRMRGTPFKYFRFVIITNFSSGHSLSGTSVLFDTRMTNKLR